MITFKRQYPSFLFPGKTQMETSTEPGVVIASEPILDSIGPTTWLKAARLIRQYAPDLIIFKFWMPFFAPCFGSVAWLSRRGMRSKVLYICDNVIPHEKRPGDITLTKYAFRSADFFITQSEVVRKELLALLPEANQTLVPHPVYDIFGEILPKDNAKERLGLQDEHIILFFGYVRDYKGLDLVLRALPLILQKVPVRLLVVGEFYSDRRQFDDLIAQLGLEEQVSVYAEFVPQEEVNKYFSAADVVVLPYKSATQSGIVQLAYHFDKPCIVTDVGGLSEVVLDGKTGFVVPPDDVTALAAAVSNFYVEKREPEFSRNVSKEKRNYSWDRMLDAIEEFAKTMEPEEVA